jgi:hypothetical protein
MKRRTMIADRATAAREQGREVDAGRCEDKARDWASIVRAMDKNKA